VEIDAINRPILVGQDFRVLANITNHGTQIITNLQVDIEVQDFTGRQELTRPHGSEIISLLEPGSSSTVTWLIKPAVGGIYFINVSIDFALDEIKGNNFFSLTETAEVYIYYNSFKSDDQNWESDSGWTRLNFSNDLYPTQHSWANVWYVGNSTTTLVDPSVTSILYSPIIDLDGAQTNLNYGGDQIKIDFKWFGRASENDKLYFEYALDHSDNWTLFNTPEKEGSMIYGDQSAKWYSWDALGTDDLFGHHVQFRWRFESDSESDFTEMGYYIDDFSVWVVQEQYGRPKILGCQVTPRAIINDSRDEAIITCEVEMDLHEIEEVYANLELLGGQKNQTMYDDGLNGDYEANDNIYSTKFTVPPSILAGEKIIKISVSDKNGNFDNDYLKILIKENLPPVIKTHFPININVMLNESEELEFSVEVYDPEGGEVQFEWYINSVLNPYWTDNYFLFNTSFHDEFSAGNYALGVRVSDDGLPSKTDYFEWNIEVINVLPDFKVNENDIYLDNVNVTVNDLVEIDVQVHNLRKPPESNVIVYFIQQSSNDSISDSVFSVHNIELFNGTASTLLTVNWQANLSFNSIKIWVDPEDNITELNEDNNIAIIPINVSQPQIEPPITDNGKNPHVQTIPTYLYILAIGVVATLISLFIAIGTEFGKYKLFLAFAPLYYRVTGDKILEHELRSKIYLYIRAHPGDHYRSIMAALEIKNGTLVHHLSRLEQEELIKSERDGYFKRFYPVGMRIPKSDVGMYYPEGVATYNIGEHQVSEIQLRIIKIIRDHPGLAQKEIAQRINESRRVVNYHIKLLLQHELIKVIKIGRKTQCFIADRVSSS
jgi:predicted transcriptional regulator